MKNKFATSYQILILLFVFLFACKSDDKLQTELQKIAKSINQECPIQYDAVTRLDHCEAFPNRVLKYSYTLLFTPNKVDTSSFREKTQKTLLYNIQTTPTVRYLKDNNVTFIYSYKDAKGDKWAEITITPEEYNKPAVKPEPLVAQDILEGSGNNSLLEQMVAEVNKMIPITFEENNVTLAKCQALSEQQIIEYTYKLNTESIATFDSIQHKKNVYANLLNLVEVYSDIDLMFSKGISIKYIYLDKDGKYLYTFNMSPEEYKRAKK